MNPTPTVHGLGFLEIGGQKREFLVGTNQAYIFCGLPTQRQEGKQLTLAAYYDLFADGDRFIGGPYRDFLYSALLAAADLRGWALDFDVQTVGVWMDAPEADPLQLAIPFNEMLAQLLAKAEAQAERQKKALGQAQPEAAKKETASP